MYIRASNLQINPMKKPFLITIFCLFFNLIGYAQNYKTGIGLRLGYPAGLTFKHFTSEHAALEGIIGYIPGSQSDINLTLLYERHSELFDPTLQFFWGIGGHAGTRSSIITFGGDIIGGFEYTFDRSPISICFDLKPTLAYADETIKLLMHGGLSIRYAIK